LRFGGRGRGEPIKLRQALCRLTYGASNEVESCFVGTVGKGRMDE